MVNITVNMIHTKYLCVNIIIAECTTWTQARALSPPVGSPWKHHANTVLSFLDLPIWNPALTPLASAHLQSSDHNH